MVLSISMDMCGNPIYRLKNKNGYTEVYKGSEAYSFDWQNYLQYWDGKVQGYKKGSGCK